jgi:hypothetical protein
VGVLANTGRAPSRVACVKLSRRLVIETYALCRQAERSVDKVLDYRWPEFTAYYRGNRGAAVKRVVEQLRQLASDGACDPSPGREELTRHPRRPGLVQFLFGKWLAAGKKEWSIPCREIGFTAAALQALARLIDQDERPDHDTLVELRMDLWAAQWLLEGHCYGLSELARAVRMEHFSQSDHLVTVTLADLIRHLDGDNELPGHAP